MAATREKVSLGSVYTTGEGNGSLLEEITEDLLPLLNIILLVT